MQFKTLLICPVPRINCKEHGIKSLQVPWADMKGRFTMLFERFAIDVLQSANNKTKAPELLGLSWDEVHHIQERAVARGLARRKIDQTYYLGIDEKSFLKGHSYASILYDREGNNALKGTRYTWLRNPMNWTTDDKKTFKSLQADHLKVGRAWSIKEVSDETGEKIYKRV